jgi:hypothetical protein
LTREGTQAPFLVGDHAPDVDETGGELYLRINRDDHDLKQANGSVAMQIVVLYPHGVGPTPAPSQGARSGLVQVWPTRRTQSARRVVALARWV